MVYTVGVPKVQNQGCPVGQGTTVFGNTGSRDLRRASLAIFVRAI